MDIRSKNYVIAVVLSVVVLVFILSSIVVYKWINESTLGITLFSKQVSSEKLVNNLSSGKRNLVITSLSLLEDRHDSKGKEQALQLLLSNDDYIWLNAGQYLAVLGDQQAIPYLIKGLNHPASRAHDKVAKHLEQLTGEVFGKDQKKWIEWWNTTNPNSEFSFEYNNQNNRTMTILSSSHILVNNVEDPLTIGHMGSKIKLIGIKLKENADQERALITLKTAVLFQVIQLEIDNNSELDEEKTTQALVYWIREGPENLLLVRKDLPPVPFSSKTLIQEYLIRSGLYEVNLDDVKNAEIKNILEKIKEND